LGGNKGNRDRKKSSVSKFVVVVGHAARRKKWKVKRRKVGGKEEGRGRGKTHVDLQKISQIFHFLYDVNNMNVVMIAINSTTVKQLDGW
jgi:hypothetical protein